MIKYKIDIMQALREHGYSRNYLLKNKFFGNATFINIKNGKPINFETLDRICDLLKCDVGDILEHTPNQ